MRALSLSSLFCTPHPNPLPTQVGFTRLAHYNTHIEQARCGWGKVRVGGIKFKIASYFYILLIFTASPLLAQENPDMTPEAINLAQINFHECLAGLWPQAQARGISQ